MLQRYQRFMSKAAAPWRFKMPKLLLSDLDGTLVDSLPDLAYAVDVMMTQLDLPPPGQDCTRHWVGNGVERLVKRALTGDMYAEPEMALYARALPLFNTVYRDYSGQSSALYPHVKSTLQWFKDRGCKLGCVTNKSTRFTAPLLEHMGLTDYFDVVVSGDTLPCRKPDPAPLKYGAQRVQIPLKHTLFLGDSVNDVKAARAAACPVVCVSYGYNHGEDIRSSRPDAVVDDLGEIPALFEPHMNAKVDKHGHYWMAN